MSADPKSKHSVETVSGLYLDFANPTPEMISVHDIAWGLSRQPRFCGQTLGEYPLSVAQHSLNVAALSADILLDGSSVFKHAFAYFENRGDEDVLDVMCSKVESANLRWGAFRVGLFHDGSEAFLCDLPTPAKRLPLMDQAYSPVEEALMSCVYKVAECYEFSRQPVIQKIVRYADMYALSFEAYHLIPSRGQGWSSIVRIDEELRGKPISVLTAPQAFKSFKNMADVTRNPKSLLGD